jgi:FixJ family two-component response regulator
LTTGFSEAVTAETVQALGLAEFIMKPLISRDFLSAIKRALSHSVQAESLNKDRHGILKQQNTFC